MSSEQNCIFNFHFDLVLLVTLWCGIFCVAANWAGPGDFPCSARCLHSFGNVLIQCLLNYKYISVCIDVFHGLSKLLGALLGLMFSGEETLYLVILKLYQESQVIQCLVVTYWSFALGYTEVFGKIFPSFISYRIISVLLFSKYGTTLIFCYSCLFWI